MTVLPDSFTKTFQTGCFDLRSPPKLLGVDASGPERSVDLRVCQF